MERCQETYEKLRILLISTVRTIREKRIRLELDSEKQEQAEVDLHLEAEQILRALPLSVGAVWSNYIMSSTNESSHCSVSKKIGNRSGPEKVAPFVLMHPSSNGSSKAL